MSQNEEVFTAEEKRELAVKAVNRLIADAEECAYLTSKARAAVLNLFPWSRIALTSFGNLPLRYVTRAVLKSE